MRISLKEIPGWNSPYGKNGALVPLPKRMRFLHPEAYKDLEFTGETLIFTDVYRSPEASLLARKTKRGVQLPGYSAHNFGLAIDVDVDRSMKRLKFDKTALDIFLEARGFVCFVKGHKRAKEDWHYTYKAADYGSIGVEAAIKEFYGRELYPDKKECQLYLKELGLYGGDVDGKIGPLSKEAILAFQRTWMLQETAELDEKTARTLAVVSAERDLYR